MTILKDSSSKEDFKVRYEQIWDHLQYLDEGKAEIILEKMEYELLPIKEKIIYKLKPLKTHFLWIIPLSIIILFVLLYLLFLWVSLLVE